ncbi:type II secretion system F family protein [Lederbergia citri]|uniref:Type II secretion system F family protein n=1 Tax=Lederbergia citri TaxID=2833580 RepID=A0A942YI35_9BACI|nr:type II secretion system F family protein [Lederbergia citri]MBS4197913.1 type II secretion system F family protein [Lederbergia citri]
MLVFFFFLTVTLSFYAVISWRVQKKQLLQDRLENLFPESSEHMIRSVREEELREPIMKRLKQTLWTHTRVRMDKKLSPKNVLKLEAKLQQAGNPFGMGPAEYKGIQFILAILLPILFAGWGILADFGGGVLFFLAVAGLGASFLLPSVYLNMKRKARTRLALKELPDFLDLLTVSLEAGLGFDSALSKVTAKKPGVLSGEFRRALEEMRLGKVRREALSGIRERLDLNDVKSLIGSIIQAEKLGIGMVQVLRVRSEEVRDMRKQRAEETAMKAPVKMLFPLVFFIFPSLFIVLLGPAVIQLMTSFK